MGWPIRVPVLGAVIRNAPAVLFAITMLRARPPAEDRRWFLFALVVWMGGQSLVLAHGRATHAVASRYMDLFAIDVLTNFACLLVVAKNWADARAWTVPMAAVWAAVVLGSLGASVRANCRHDLPVRRDTARVQEHNTRNYVLTGDIGHLMDKPHLHVPYPRPEQLASVLDTPSIRSILPRNINATTATEGGPVAVGRWDVRVDKTLDRWGGFVIAGAALGVAFLTIVSLARGTGFL